MDTNCALVRWAGGGCYAVRRQHPCLCLSLCVRRQGSGLEVPSLIKSKQSHVPGRQDADLLLVWWFHSMQQIEDEQLAQTPCPSAHAAPPPHHAHLDRLRHEVGAAEPSCVWPRVWLLLRSRLRYDFPANV